MADSAPDTPAVAAVPDGLAEAGVALWQSVIEGVTFRSDELAVLELACRTADQIADLEAALEGGGAMIDGSRGQRVLHPAIPELRQQRQLQASLLNRLDVPEGAGIAGEWDNLTASERARKAAGARWRPSVVA